MVRMTPMHYIPVVASTPKIIEEPHVGLSTSVLVSAQTISDHQDAALILSLTWIVACSIWSLFRHNIVIKDGDIFRWETIQLRKATLPLNGHKGISVNK
jgi:hypothetical protein